MTEAAADAVAAPNDVAIAPPNRNTVCVGEEKGEGEGERVWAIRERGEKLRSMKPKSGDNSYGI